MEPRVQYTRTADGVNIAFWTIGEGQPLVIMPSMPMSHIEFEWQIPEWRAFYERIAERRLVVRYDGRGTGLSDRRAIKYSLETLLMDLDAVVSRLNLERFALLAAYHPGPAALHYAARHPERLSHLLLWCTYAAAAEMSSPVVTATRSLIQQDWEVYAQTAAHVLLGWNATQPAQNFARFIREANTPDGVMALFDAAAEFDARDVLDQVKTPTLVMQRRGISWMDIELARNLAARIPDARLALLEGESIAPYWGDVDSVVNAILDFLGEGRAGPQRAATSLRTILFTDIEGHTAMMRSLGDERGRQMLRDHERITREALRAHGGSEIKTMGDGFLATFGSAQRALQCAVALQKAFHDYSRGPIKLRVRVGLNAGEPIAEGGELYGTAVIMASRCAAQAKGGEILATDVVRQLVSGRGFEFGDRGLFDLAGFEDPVRLYEVKWSPE
ncbi:MAG TPA: adenylate/guanylate cyclase domain-containing protein [Dehalococcoidia bacterium]|nr:adenylate/guanylate cyclase domain-containing protein [Dehalococcoidia bacterium]